MRHCGRQFFSLELNIHFAYPTFPWANNARDKAAVHVIIIGLSARSEKSRLYQYVQGEWHCKMVDNISPYLVEGSRLAIIPRNSPLIKGVPPLLFGNKPTDGGYLLLDRFERDELLKQEPQAERWLKKGIRCR
ncbi:DNA methyltransferase [Dickeya ananatis]